MPTVLDNFIIVFSQQGAEKVRKTISEMEKEVSKSVKKTLNELKTRKKEEDNLLKDWVKAIDRHEREQKRSGNAEARNFEFVEKNKRKEAAKTIAEIGRREKERQAEVDRLNKKDAEAAKARENRRKTELMYADMFDKIERDAAKAREQEEIEKSRAEKKRTQEKINNYNNWKKTNSLEAREKRQEEGREWLAAKRRRQEAGHLRAQQIAISKQKKKDREEEKKARMEEKAAYDAMLARQSNIRKIASFFGLSRGMMLAGGIGAGVLGAGMLARGIWNFTSGGLKSKVRNALSYLGTGTTPANAAGIDKVLFGYGGEKGEAIQLLSQLSAGIGAMRFGDTGLVQTLGTFGISGIGAHSKSKDVLRAVWQRAQGMTEEEREAMFNALGFTGAMKGFMRKGTFDELEATAMVSEWQKSDVEKLEAIYDVENTLSKTVEKIASSVGSIAYDIQRVVEFFFPKPLTEEQKTAEAQSRAGAMGFGVKPEGRIPITELPIDIVKRTQADLIAQAVSDYYGGAAVMYNPKAKIGDFQDPALTTITNNYNYNYGSFEGGGGTGSMQTLIPGQ